MIKKMYVSVIVRFGRNGAIQPLFIVCQNGDSEMRYQIEKILQFIPEKAAQSGGCGMYFRCRIRGRLYSHERNLFYEENTGRWFVETEA